MNIAQLLPLAAKVAAQLKRDDSKCVACNPGSGVDATEWHHIIPQHLGGAPDSPQAFLCGSCHNKIHAAAHKFAKQDYSAKLTLQQSLLVKLIVKAMFADKEDEHNLPRHIMFKVPDHVLRRMHKRKSDKGFSNLTDYVKDLIQKDISNL